MNKKSDMTIDDLALMVQQGFDDLTGRLKKHDSKFDSIDQRFDKIDQRFDKIEEDISGLKDGQERNTLKLDNVAYRFELTDLERRVQFLEKRAGC